MLSILQNLEVSPLLPVHGASLIPASSLGHGPGAACSLPKLVWLRQAIPQVQGIIRNA